MSMKQFDEKFEEWIQELECKDGIWTVYNRDFTNFKERIRMMIWEDTQNHRNTKEEEI